MFDYVLGVEGDFSGGGVGIPCCNFHFSLEGPGTKIVYALILKLFRDRRDSAPSV